MTVRTINEVWRDYSVDGNPASGAHKPIKVDIRDTLNSKLQVSPRQVLAANRSYYVRTDGSDSNSGTVNNAAGAFLTIQKAIDTISKELDLNGFSVTINVAAGTYTGNVTISSPFIGRGDVTVVGDAASASSRIISVASGNCFTVSRQAPVTISGVKLVNSGAGHGVSADTGAIVTIASVDTGAIGGSAYNCGSGAFISINGNYTISGGGTSHWHVGAFGQISVNNLTCTLTGTPAYSAYFVGTAQGAVTCPTVTFVGAATGRKFLAHNGGVIVGGGTDNSFLPGNVAGYTPMFGAYGCATVGGTNVSGWEITPDIYSANYLDIKSKNFNADTWNTHIRMQNDLFQGTGSFYMNGANCYSSGVTHLAGDAQVSVASGAVDGVSFTSKASAAGGGTVFQMSAGGGTVGYMRRRVSDGAVLAFYRDTTAVGSISVTAAATAFNTSSDYRLKQDITPIDDPLDRLNALKPINFAWISTGQRQDGFLAHEVQEIVPDAVTGAKDAELDIGTATRAATADLPEDAIEGIEQKETPDGYAWTKTGTRPDYQGIDLGKLVPLLTAALQAAVARIDALEARASP